MKKVLFALVLAVMLIAIPAELFAGTSGAPIQQYEMPFLITSGGQGAGSKTLQTQMKILKDYVKGTDYLLEDETPARYEYIDSGKYKTIVIVMSVTEKGLGASGITIEDEIKFLQEVIKKAKAQNMKIVAVSMEADARNFKVRTNGNERVIDTVCPYADWIISTKANNEDKRFDAFGCPVTIIDKATELVKLIPSIFVK